MPLHLQSYFIASAAQVAGPDTGRAQLRLQPAAQHVGIAVVAVILMC